MRRRNDAEPIGIIVVSARCTPRDGTVDTPGHSHIEGMMMTRSRVALPLLLTAIVALASVGAGPAEATFPGTNGELGFSVHWEDQRQISMIDPDGTGRTTLTHTARRTNHDAAWSADGSKLAYIASTRRSERLLTMNADGTDRHLIFEADYLKDPAWSPNGTQIAVSRFAPAQWAYRMLVVDVDGSATTLLPGDDDGGYDIDPDWSPDGSRIAFKHVDDDGSSIQTMNPDGSNRTTVVDPAGPEYAYAPSWSPDGTRIAFVVALTGSDIFTINSDGSGQFRVTTTRRSEQRPAWSPDGGQIAFTRDAGTAVDIWIADVDGSDAQRITDTHRRDEYGVAWRAI
jgi:TolB protein